MRGLFLRSYRNNVYMNIEFEPGIKMGFKLEVMNPKVGALLGFQYWEADDEDDYSTFKIHFVWIALRWDW